MTDIATAYVRVRPNTAGFQAEAEAQLKGAVAGITKGLAFAIGAAGVGEGIAKLAEEAASHQSAVAQTQAAVKAAGAQWVVYGKNVEQALDEQARSTGFSFTDLYQGFIRLETQIKNTPKALKALGEAEDVARARGLGLAQAATAIARASAGNYQSLSRLGIVIPKYTQAQDALKQKLVEIQHAETAVTQSHAKHYQGTLNLTAAELALTKLSPVQLAQLKEQIKSREAAAEASDKVRGAETALGEVQARYGNQAETFAKTAAGQYARFRVEVAEAAAELGQVLLPYLADAAKQAGEWAREIGESKGAAAGLKVAAGDVATTVRDIGAAIKSVEPLLKLVGEGVSGVGPGAILAGVAAYKAIGIVAGTAAKAQGQYDALAAKSTATQTANTVTTTRQTAAQARLAAATQAVVDATAEQEAVYSVATGEFVATTASVEALAAAEAELAAATEAADVAQAGQAAGGMSKLALAGDGLLATLTGPGGIAVGIAAVAAGLYYLSTLEDEGVQKTNALQKSYSDFTDAVNKRRAAQAQIVDTSTAVNAATDAKRAAQDSLTQARQRLDSAVSDGKSAKIQHTAYDEVTAAEKRWRDANTTLLSSEQQKRAAIDAASKALQAQKKDYQDLIVKQLDLAKFDAQPRVDARAGQIIGGGAIGAAQYAASLRKVADETKGLSDAQKFGLRQTADYVAQLGKIPDTKTLKFLLDDESFYNTLHKDVATLKAAFAPVVAGLLGKAIPEDARGGPSLTVAVKAKNKQLGADAANAYTTSFVQTIDASTIATALSDAIASARSQLSSSGDALAGAVGSALDARLAATEKNMTAAQKALQADIAARQAAQTARDTAASSNDAALKLKELQDELGPGALTADQAVQLQAAKNAVLDAQDAVANAAQQAKADTIDKQKTSLETQEGLAKTASARRIADLDDEFNRGLISQAKYISGIRAELAKQSVSYKTSGQLLGKAFADGFADSLREITGQSKALSATGQARLRGTPTSAKPISPLGEEAKAIQAFIDQVAQSGGKFNVANADKLPKGVKLSDLIAAAGSQKAEAAYRVKTGKAQDSTVEFTGQTADHTRAILDELRKPKPPVVVIVPDGKKAKRKIAQATR